MIETSGFLSLKMGIKEKRETPIGPVLLKFGVALALSLGGIVFTFLRSRTIKTFDPRPSLPSSSGEVRQVDLSGEGDEEEDLKLVKGSSSLKDRFSVAKDPSSNLHCDISPISRDGFISPEFDQLVEECNMAQDVSDTDGVVCFVPDTKSTMKHILVENEEHQRVIRSLQNRVKFLEERERMLEVQLLEYYGLKEQEVAVNELQNRLGVHIMEAKLYKVKVESLQEDKRRLETQVTTCAKEQEVAVNELQNRLRVHIMEAELYKVKVESLQEDKRRLETQLTKAAMDLEDAKAKIKLLRSKLGNEVEQNRAQILRLKERVVKLQEKEKTDSELDGNVEMQINEVKELEELKKAYHTLKMENSDLHLKLEKLQNLATSALEDGEIEALKRESQQLRQQNEGLSKEIEQLQTDRYTDLEELVYLRWINACLRYELRNYQPGPGETVARDLSKTLSPESEKKAKQLILEYAKKEGSGEKVMTIQDFDSGRWPRSLLSYLAESDEPSGELSAEKTNHPSTKTKVFPKLMKIWRGKDDQTHNQTPSDDNVGRDLGNQADISVGVDALADDVVVKTTRNSSARSSGYSFNVHGSDSVGQKSSSSSGQSSTAPRRMSHDGTMTIFRKVGFVRGSGEHFSPAVDAEDAAKTELVKYAEALNISSHVKAAVRRRSAAFGSF